MGKIEDEFKRSAQQRPVLLTAPPPEGAALFNPPRPVPPAAPQGAALLNGETRAPVQQFSATRSAIGEAAARPDAVAGAASTRSASAPPLARPAPPPARPPVTAVDPAGTALRSSVAEAASRPDAVAEAARARAPVAPAGPQFTLDPPAPRPQPMTVEPNRTPSVPASNPISNPNVHRVGAGVVSNEGLSYENGNAGKKIPDQVGNRARPPTVPGMPPAVEPVTAPTTRVVPPAGAAAGPSPAAAATGGAPGSYGRMAQAASSAMDQLVPKGKLASAAGGMLKKASPYIVPVMEGKDIAKVAMDPKSTGFDVAEQAAVGVGRGAATLAGAGLGAAALAPSGPGAVVGGLVGGAAGYFGGDAAIKGLRSAVRSLFGLGNESNETPVERTDARNAVTKAALAAAPKPAAAATPASAGAAAAPATATAGGTIAAAGRAPVQGAAQDDQAARSAQYSALEQQMQQNPIHGVIIGNNPNGASLMYKDGSVGVHSYGQPLPPELAQFNTLSEQMTALREGRALPAQAQQQGPGSAPPPAAGAAAPPQSAMTGLTPVQQSIADEAAAQGYDPRLAMAKISLETGGKFSHGAKNPNSSAAGLGQLTIKNRAQYGTEQQWQDPKFALTSTIDFMRKQDADVAQRLGRAPTPTESYLGHMLGPIGAATLLKANQDLPIEQVVAMYEKNPKLAQQIVNNNGMGGMTAGEAVAKWHETLNRHAAPFGQPAAGAAPAAAVAAAGTAGAGDFARSQPVGVLEGMNQFVEVPMPGGGMAKVPGAVWDAGLAQGNVRAAVNDYLGNQADAVKYKQNPTAGTLEVAQTNAAAQLDRASITAQAHAEAARYNGKNRYLKLDGGIDPKTFQPRPEVLFDTQTGTRVNVDGGYPPVPPAAVAMLKQSPQLAAQFDAKYGPGAAKKAMGN